MLLNILIKFKCIFSIVWYVLLWTKATFCSSQSNNFIFDMINITTIFLSIHSYVFLYLEAKCSTLEHLSIEIKGTIKGMVQYILGRSLMVFGNLNLPQCKFYSSFNCYSLLTLLLTMLIILRIQILCNWYLSMNLCLRLLALPN